MRMRRCSPANRVHQAMSDREGSGSVPLETRERRGMDQSKADKARELWPAQVEYGWDMARPSLADKLRALADYYTRTRGVGHTRVLQLGAERADCLILALTQQHADLLTHASGLSRGRGMAWGDFPQCLGWGVWRPLAVDHAVLEAIIQECLREMARLEGRAAAAEQREQTAWTEGAETTDKSWRQHIAWGLTDDPQETVVHMMQRWE